MVGLETLKFDWNKTLSREEALLNGPGMGGTGGIADDDAVVEAEAVLGATGNGRAPPGLTVACILASEDAVGAYNLELEEGIVLVFFALRDEVDCDNSAGAGGAGAGRTFFKISA